MTTDEILFGLGLTVALAVGSQLLASWLRIPALIVLLPTGFVAGALTDDVDPHRLLGAAFEPLVSLSVALILYDSGLGLDMRKLTGDTRRIVVRLIVLGVPLTMAGAALLAAPLLDLSAGAAVMLGAILVVSGPTVVGPLLGFVRPAERVGRILLWEGSLVDPIGGILGAVVFSGVIHETRVGSGTHVLHFTLSLGVGLAGGLVGSGLLWLLMRWLRFGEVLAATAQLATVVAVAAACDIARDDAGLLAAIIMGLAVANLKSFDLPEHRPVSETIVQLSIGLLFISISATITPESVADVALPALGLVVALVVLVRPLLAYLATRGTDLTTGEWCFIGWMDPRGIVAAATASTFSTQLTAQGIGGASKILPVTFLVIVATVTLYGLTATPVARRLRVVRAAG
ncbi:cation:proton antiporter [Spirillospora sp. CA-142024]|uniref:cation:proton antiporter domain-containing protein n=1 Tax=Spirillospora sp. CA-142024 TaxID=3240036 RepID=UPI003D94FC1F